jgi:phage terminase Nu1 subunit (DNA packaging protein)
MRKQTGVHGQMRNENADKNEIFFSAKDLAAALDLTERRVQQLAEEGIVVKVGRGKYKAIESIRNFIKNLQDQEQGNGDVNYFEERARHEKAKREKAELIVSVMRGELHRAEDVKDVMNDMIAAFKSRMMALPTKLAPILAGKSDIPAIQRLISREVHDALAELSEYNPQLMHEKNQDYVGMLEDDEKE